MPILSDDEVRALATEVKKQRVEIDVLKKVIGALIMEVDLREENVDQITGMRVTVCKDGHKLYHHKDEMAMVNGDALSKAGFVEEGAQLLESKRPAFRLPEKFFDLFYDAAFAINNNLNPSDDNTSN